MALDLADFPGLLVVKTVAVLVRRPVKISARVTNSSLITDEQGKCGTAY
jgi:hypothetical protein